MIVVVLACLLQVMGTLWTPKDGFQMNVVNYSNTAAHVSVVDIVSVRGADTGDTPDPKNFDVFKLSLPHVVVVRAKSSMVISLPLTLNIERFYDATPECEDYS